MVKTHHLHFPFDHLALRVHAHGGAFERSEARAFHVRTEPDTERPPLVARSLALEKALSGSADLLAYYRFLNRADVAEAFVRADQGKASRSALTSGTLAITDVTVIPMDTERTLPGHTVVVRGDRIVAVGSQGSVQVPAGARQLARSLGGAPSTGEAADGGQTARVGGPGTEDDHQRAAGRSPMATQVSDAGGRAAAPKAGCAGTAETYAGAGIAPALGRDHRHRRDAQRTSA